MNIKKFLGALIILNLNARSWQWNDTFISTFLAGFWHIAQLPEVIWFISQQLTTEHTQNLDSFIKRIDDFTQASQFVWTDRNDGIRMTNLVSKRTGFAMVFTTGASDPVMHSHNLIMKGRHSTFSMFIYVSKVANFSHIDEICYAMYKGSFTNSLVYYQTVEGYNNMFSYSQYPKYAAENATDVFAFLGKKLKNVMNAKQDVGGYIFQTPLKQNIPYVFKFIDENEKPQIQGSTFLILNAFVDLLNGTLAEYDLERGTDALNMNSVLDLVRSKRIDLTAHAYALFQPDDDLDKSYPIMVVKWCLMVPQRNSISTFLYILQPFEWTVWIVVATVFVTLCGVDFLRLFWQTKWLKSKHDRILGLFNDAWLQDLCFVVNMATSQTLRIANWMRFLQMACIFFFGFFLSANYTSYLGSFLAVTLFRAQINSIEDIVEAQLPVMVIDYELDFLLAEGYELPPAFRKLVTPVDASTFNRHQLLLNTSFAYFVTDDVWHFLDATQKHLKQSIFKFSDICFGSYHFAFPIQKDSAVWRDLEYFIFRMHANGLMQQYENTALQNALAAGYLQRLVETNEYSSAGLEHLKLLFMFCGVMALVAGLTLLTEILVHKHGGRKRWPFLN